MKQDLKEAQARRRPSASERGFSLLEMVVCVAIIGVLVMVLASLEAELVQLGRRAKVDLMSNPDRSSLIERLRRDVLASNGYPSEFGGYQQSPETLLLSGRDEHGSPETVVYNFSVSGEPQRLLFRGAVVTSEWKTRGAPRFQIGSFKLPDGSIAVRIQGFDKRDQLIVDRIFEPRAH